MNRIICAIHGILTGNTRQSWPEEFLAWMAEREPEARVLTKKYIEGPFPRFNWFKNRWLARALGRELIAELQVDDFPAARLQVAGCKLQVEVPAPSAISREEEGRGGTRPYQPQGAPAPVPKELQVAGCRLQVDVSPASQLQVAGCKLQVGTPTPIPNLQPATCNLQRERSEAPNLQAATCNLQRERSEPDERSEVWFVAHSNGACIALLAARYLIGRGTAVAGLILTGAACEADVRGNGVMEWLREGELGRAIAYSSAQDEVVAGDAGADMAEGGSWLTVARDWLWGKAMWPYGCLGRTGWRLEGRSFASSGIFTRWFAGGHSGYFKPERVQETFERIYADVSSGEGAIADHQAGSNDEGVEALKPLKR